MIRVIGDKSIEGNGEVGEQDERRALAMQKVQ